MMIKPGKSKVKNELQKIVEKLMDLKLQKTETSMEIFYLEIFSRAMEISRQICASSNSFFTEKIQPLRRSLPYV